jgi:hypothetical protein
LGKGWSDRLYLLRTTKLAHIIAALKLKDIVKCRTLRRVEICMMRDSNREIGGVDSIAKWVDDGFLEENGKKVEADVEFGRKVKKGRRR